MTVGVALLLLLVLLLLIEPAKHKLPAAAWVRALGGLSQMRLIALEAMPVWTADQYLH